jgi:hypothetical protein
VWLSQAVLMLVAVLWCVQNVVLYAGSAEDRRIIREHEWFYPRHKVSWPGRACCFKSVLHVYACMCCSRHLSPAASL